MLDSLQLEPLLISFGFSLTQERTHALGYEHPLLPGQSIYLKDGRGKLDEPRKAVPTRPLVIHPKFGTKEDFSAILAVSPNPDMAYMNGNMADYPAIGGKSATGIALDVPDQGALFEVMRVIGLGSLDTSQPEEDIRIAEASLPTDETERKAVIAARRGQGKFRSELIGYWRGCAATSCTSVSVLRASHIKPWRISSNKERLDPFNGLLLTPNLDAAFDRGLISFADDGRILINKGRITAPDLSHLGIHPGVRLHRVEPAHQPYLADHRRLHIFEK